MKIQKSWITEKENKTMKWNGERNGGRAAISQVDFWWNKSFLRDSPWSSKQFYRNVREKSIHLPMKYLVSLLFNLRVQ